MTVWQKCHSESVTRFDKLSDRAADEESISLTGDSFRLSRTGDKLRMTPLFNLTNDGKYLYMIHSIQCGETIRKTFDGGYF